MTFTVNLSAISGRDVSFTRATVDGTVRTAVPGGTSAIQLGAHATLQGTLARLKAKALFHVLVVAALCLGIAIVLTVIDGGFWLKLLYSVCIGTACTMIVHLTRAADAWLGDRLRQARGLPESRDSVLGGLD